MIRQVLNPFLYGKPVPTGRFFGRQGQVGTLFSRLYNGESTAIVGEPHIGKTSLLKYIADEDTRREWIAQAFAQHVFIDFDCHLMTADFKPADFWYEIVQRIGEANPDDDVARQCGLCAQNNYGSFTLERLFKLLAKHEWHAVLLIDEFDTLLNHPNFNRAEFLGALRSLATRTDGLVVITASRLSVSRMNRLSLDNNPYGSPFFNNFIEVRLLPLNPLEAQQLIEKTLQKAGHTVTYTDADYTFLYALAGRHPFLLQIAAASLYDSLTASPALPNPHDHALLAFQQRSEAHFDDFWRSLESNEQRTLTVLALAENAGRAAGHAFEVREFGAFEWYEVDMRHLAELGIVEQRAISGATSQWAIAVGGFTRWLFDNVIAGTRYAEDFGAWLQHRQQEGLLTRDEVNRLVQVQQQFVGVSQAENIDLIRLRRNMVLAFDSDGLQILCADMSIDYDSLSSEGKEMRVLKLIDHCRQHGRLSELLTHCREARANVEW
jgi:hypothetical protein